MTALGLAMLSMYLFVLTQSRQRLGGLWLAAQVAILVAIGVVVRWDRRTSP